MRRILPASFLASLLGALATGCASRPPVWVPAHGDKGHCEPVSSCSAKDYDCVRKQQRDLAFCAFDRARQTSERLGPTAGFDALAVYLSSKQGHCDLEYDARKEAHERLMGFLPGQQRAIEQAFDSGRIDLAARRAEFVVGAFREVDGDSIGSPPDEGPLLTKIRDLHDRAAERLAATLPAAALFHRCAGPWPTHCPSDTSEERSKALELAWSMDTEVELRVAPACKEVASVPLVYPDQHRAGSLRTAHVSIDIGACGVTAPKVEKISLACAPPPPPVRADDPPRGIAPNAPGRATQNLTIARAPDRNGIAQRVTSRMTVEAQVRIDGHLVPIHVDVTNERIEPPEGCTPRDPLPAPTHVVDTVRYQLSSALGSAIATATRIEPDQLIAAAAQAAADGDLDRADHFYELALLSARDDGARPSPATRASEWFNARYGSPLISEPSDGFKVPTAIGYVYSTPSYSEYCY